MFFIKGGSAYMEGVPLFKGLDISLLPHSWTCLLGESGVGKTTLLKLFAGLKDAIAFEGMLHAPPHVAFMAQDDLLLPWLSVLENVMLGARLRGEKANKTRAYTLLKDVGLSAHFEKYPQELSGGERQRVALARTLMEEREVILLDEPFSALDALTRGAMQELTVRLLKGKTILLVTHDPLEAARLGEQILIMKKEGMVTIPHPKTPIPRDMKEADIMETYSQLMVHLSQKTASHA